MPLLIVSNAMQTILIHSLRTGQYCAIRSVAPLMFGCARLTSVIFMMKSRRNDCCSPFGLKGFRMVRENRATVVCAPRCVRVRDDEVLLCLKSVSSFPLIIGRLFFGSAIQSVLNQTFQDFEIIVVDDASDDETLRGYPKLYGAADPVHTPRD